MSPDALSAAELVEALHRAAHRQANRAEAGDWEEVHQLMRERAALMEEMAGMHPGSLRPLRGLLVDIERQDENLEEVLAGEREEILRILAELRRAERSIRAYATEWVPRSPEYLDERK